MSWRVHIQRSFYNSPSQIWIVPPIRGRNKIHSILEIIFIRKRKYERENNLICINPPFLVLHRPLLNILARDAAKEGFSATIKAVFILLRYFVHIFSLNNERFRLASSLASQFKWRHHHLSDVRSWHWRDICVY